MVNFCPTETPPEIMVNGFCTDQLLNQQLASTMNRHDERFSSEDIVVAFPAGF
jgi:hypothetical protein